MIVEMGCLILGVPVGFLLRRKPLVIKITDQVLTWSVRILLLLLGLALGADERLPYWTELWPSSLVLADWLYQRRESLRGQPCLDLGCGIGLTALVAQWLGANVIGMDYEPEALRFARRNAEHNAVPQPLWTVMDWRKPAVKRRSLRFIWGGDIMYEQRFAAPVLDFLEYALAEGGAAWVAEPSRAVYDTFRSMLVNRRWAGRCVWEKNIEALYPQERPVPVRIWEIHR